MAHAKLPFFVTGGIMLSGKKIVLGITGGIAAYKCAALVRLLVKEGAEVKVIMTPSARDFVTPQTLSVLSKNQVYTDFFDNNLVWNNHVQLSEWANLLLIAPLTANTLAKMVSGQCDNLLLATYLSARSSIVVAPAMDLEMYRHPAVSANLKRLSDSGVHIVPAETGELASGLSGEGRMAEPENILKFIKDYILDKAPLKGKKALVNAGPTYEPIDQVRFIGNRSSGKMGVAIAEAFAQQGAEVTLVLGPSHLKVKHRLIQVIPVETAQEMHTEMLHRYAQADIVVCSAAVADYAPEKAEKGKIKKGNPELNLKLLKTKDILQELGQKKQSQFLVGFALETDNLLKNAREKLERKNCDLIVANETNAENQAFHAENNQVIFVLPNNNTIDLGFKSKTEIAEELVQLIIQKRTQKK